MRSSYEIVNQIGENYIFRITKARTFFSVFDQFEVLPSNLIPKNLKKNPYLWSKKLFLEESVDLNTKHNINLSYSISN